MPASLARLGELYENRERRARELKSQGKKIIGYFCCYPPLEFITALDLVPYRISGRVWEPITQADAYLETIMCPFIRSCFDLALKGNYDFLDGLVVPHSCDTVQRIYDIWKHYRPPSYAHFLNVPHMVQSSSMEFFKEELKLFKQSLENFAGKAITPESLRRSILLHNENRALTKQLYQLRRKEPPLLSGVEATQILVAGMGIPVAEFNDLLRGVVAEISDRNRSSPQGSPKGQSPCGISSSPSPGEGEGDKGGEVFREPAKRKARILVYGSELDDIAFIQLVEECGANVVMDDLCTGTRSFWPEVKVTEDLLDGLVDRYLDKLPCPRTYRPRTGSRQEDLINRFSYLKEFIQDFGVEGVILYIIRFCDTHEFDAPDVKDYVQSLGLPVLHLEHDYSAATLEPLRTRVQAFVEMTTSEVSRLSLSQSEKDSRVKELLRADEREEVLSLVGKDKEVVNELITLVEDEDVAVRRNAAWVLGMIAEKDTEMAKPAVSHLIGLLGDSETELRWIVTWALGMIAEKDAEVVKPAVPQLIKLLEDSEAGVRGNAVGVLTKIAKKDTEVVRPAVPQLIKLLEDFETDVRWIAVVMLAGIAVKDAEVVKPAVPQLIKLLEDSQAEVRESAVGALAVIAVKHTEVVKPAVPQLIKLLEDSQADVRWITVTALTRIAAKDMQEVKPAVPRLIKLLEDSDMGVRGSAAGALGMMAVKDAEVMKLAVPRLIELLEDSEAGIRWSTVGILGIIAMKDTEAVKPAVPWLIKLLLDSDAVVRRNTVQTIGKIAEKDPKAVKAAVPQLMKLREDPEIAVRSEAYVVLAMIEEKKR